METLDFSMSSWDDQIFFIFASSTVKAVIVSGSHFLNPSESTTFSARLKA